MAYLDKQGLSYFWNKIKAYVDSKLSGVPVKPVTQAEYDALTEDEKNGDVVYLVTDAAGSDNSGSNPAMEVYDDQERVIGTWFGKPLYQRVFLGTTPSENLNMSSVSLFSISNEIELVDIDSFMIYKNGKSGVKLPYYKLGNNSFDVIYREENEIMLNANGTVHLSCPLIITLKYTKTTDEEVITDGT